MLGSYVQVFNGILGYLVLFAVARSWGGFAPTALGIVSFGTAFVGMFSIISDLGFTNAHIKRVSEGQDIGKCIGTFAAIKMVLTGAMAVVVIAVLLVMRHTKYAFHDASKESVVYVFVLYYILLSISQIATSTFNAQQRMAKTNLSQAAEVMARLPVTLAVVSAGVVVGVTGMGAVAPLFKWPGWLEGFRAFVASHAVGALAMTYIAGVFATLITAFSMFRGYKFSKPDMAVAKSYFKFAIPTILISAIAVISVNIGRVMLGMFWPAAEIGYFSGAQRISYFIIAISSSVNILLFPLYSAYHSRNEIGAIRAIAFNSVRYVSMLVMPAIAFLIVCNRQIMFVALSGDFLPGANALSAFAVFVLISVVSVPFTTMIYGMNRPDISAKISLVMCGANIALNALIIPRNGILSWAGIYGAYGAAFSSATSMFIGALLGFSASRKLAGASFPWRSFLSHVTAGTVSGASILIITQFVPITRWFSLLGFAALCVVIYAGALLAMGELKKKDLEFFMDAMHPGKMAEYVKEEIKEKEK